MTALLNFIHDSEKDDYSLDIAELKAYRQAAYTQLVNPSEENRKKQGLSAIAFLDWFLHYTNEQLKGKSYTMHQIVPQLFISGNIKKTQFKEYFRISLFAAGIYINYLKKKVTENNSERYEQAFRELFIDLEYLIIYYEVLVKKTVQKASPSSGRRPDLSPTDIFSAARELFFIEETKNISDLYLRDLKPVVMFQIRQLIEVYGRNLIGYAAIVDQNDQPVKKFTQVAWEFIASELRNSSSRITLPFPVHYIQLLNSWSNDFVHTSYIFNSYVQFYAFEVLRLLFEGSGNKIKMFDNCWHSKLDICDIKITGYESLKQDFEQYLKERKPDAKVVWLPVKKVDAYIITL